MEEPSVSNVFVVGIYAELEYLACFVLSVSVELLAYFSQSSQVFGVMSQCYYVKLICAGSCEMAEQFIDLVQCTPFIYF